MEAPPPYEGRFEVINWHEAAMVVSTKYWTVTGQPPRRILRYDSDVTAQKEEELVILQTCYDPRHIDKPRHSHNVYGRKDHVVTNIEQAQELYQMSDDQQNTANLPESNNLVEALEETDIPPDQEEESSDSDEWEPKPVKFIAIETTRDYVDIVTNYWRAQ